VRNSPKSFENRVIVKKIKIICFAQIKNENDNNKKVIEASFLKYVLKTFSECMFRKAGN